MHVGWLHQNFYVNQITRFSRISSLFDEHHHRVSLSKELSFFVSFLFAIIRSSMHAWVKLSWRKQEDARSEKKNYQIFMRDSLLAFVRQRKWNKKKLKKRNFVRLNCGGVSLKKQKSVFLYGMDIKQRESSGQRTVGLVEAVEILWGFTAAAMNIHTCHKTHDDDDNEHRSKRLHYLLSTLNSRVYLMNHAGRERGDQTETIAKKKFEKFFKRSSGGFERVHLAAAVVVCLPAQPRMWFEQKTQQAPIGVIESEFLRFNLVFYDATCLV